MTCRHLLLASLLIVVTHAEADVPWRSVRGANLRAIFVDHELADGVHYAYQFRGNGTFSGFNMGKAGAFVFGSGLAIVPFLYSGVVHDYEWLNERQFVDAVAVAMITPGPVVITVRT